MSDLNTIARPYAKAAYEYADENKRVAQWEIFLAVASAFFQQSSIKKNQSAIGFKLKLNEWMNELLIQTRQAKMTENERNFLKVLEDFNRLAVLPEILSEFQTIKAASNQICDVTIYTAQHLSESRLSSIESKMAEKTNKKVNLTVIDAPELVAGIKIEYDGLVIDQSMKGKIAQLSHQLEEKRN